MKRLIVSIGVLGAMAIPGIAAASIPVRGRAKLAVIRSVVRYDQISVTYRQGRALLRRPVLSRLGVRGRSRSQLASGAAAYLRGITYGGGVDRGEQWQPTQAILRLTRRGWLVKVQYGEIPCSRLFRQFPPKIVHGLLGRTPSTSSCYA